MENTTQTTLKKQFPSIDCAYPVALEAYQLSITRLDVMDGRIQTLLAFVISATAAVVTLAISQKISTNSFWFAAAILFFFASLGLGIWARYYGEMSLLRPSNIKKTWLTDDETTFKKDMIYWTAQYFDDNMKLSRARWDCSVVILLLFLAEAVCLTAWVLASRP